jgi:asparagine synthase (glutamine-hydrolysing)
MCGIFAYLGKSYSDEELKSFAEKIRHRGPDNTTYERVNESVFFGFHRLAINGLNEISNQPMRHNGYVMICNGEIFNYRDLIKKYNLGDVYKSNSDCEIILHLIERVGLDACCNELDGEYAFVVYDERENNIMIGRDQLGIRSLYWNYKCGTNGLIEELGVCSEAKGLVEMGLKIDHFPVNTCWDLRSNEYREIYDLYGSLRGEVEEDESTIISNIREKFESAVKKRMMSERNIACLLSGGLDSSSVTSLVAKYIKEDNKGQELHTYSIGIEGSPDPENAEIVAKYLGTKHHLFSPTEEELLDSIEKTIYQIESYDTTSVRASVGNYLISLYIKETSDNVVIFNGDVSDELFCGYIGFVLAESDEQLYEANLHMMKHIQYFDVLRSDKSISGAGLEARTPLSDPEFVKYVMSIPAKYKMFNKNKIEKYIFRKAVEDLLPEQIVYRSKQAFSDAISKSDRSWCVIIKEYVDKIYTNEEYEEKRLKYKINTPYDKESLFYREIFEKYYENQGHLVKYFWRQPFVTSTLDPSGRLLEKELLEK